jgi:ABC-2 type transport system ATP-binding protein
MSTALSTSAPPERQSGRAAAIDVVGLSKLYDGVPAVDDVTFSVATGEVFAFLGPNGAGKSTTIKILCTLARPTSGRASVAGWDVERQANAVRRRIGLVFQEQTLDQQLTAEENLRFHAVLYGLSSAVAKARVDRVLDLVGLTARRGDLVSTYSGGMARRLEIARGMLHTPSVLFLDEPTLGLDPQTRALMWDDILRMRAEDGVTVFLTTHYMEEAEYADRIGIIDQGRIVALDSPARLRSILGEDSIDLQTADDGRAEAALRAAGCNPVRTSYGLRLLVGDGEAEAARMIGIAGVPVRKVHVHRPTLDDVFLHFTGREIREQGSGVANPMGQAWRAHR